MHLYKKHTGHMTILVADDDEIVLKTIELRLKKDGYNVILTNDGREALLKIEEMPPDLIITDIMMPFASGLEIIDAVKNKQGRKIPIIVLSAVGEEKVVREALQLGADDYITKPFTPAKLSMTVKKYMPGMKKLRTRITEEIDPIHYID
jgi:DNA-binding response OmpR family regulator